MRRIIDTVRLQRDSSMSTSGSADCGDDVVNMKRTIHIVRHQRDLSISTLGSVDWGSDAGITVDEEDGSITASVSEQSTNKVRIVAGMAIVASTSPEIKALTLRRGNSFPQSFHGKIMMPGLDSPASSVASLSCLSVSSLLGDDDRNTEESKIHDDDLDTTAAKPVHDVAEQLASLSFDNIRIEAPPSPIREPVPDIKALFESKENNENFPPDSKVDKSTNTNGINGVVSNQKARKSFSSFRSSIRESFKSSGSSKSKRPPKPQPLKIVSAPKSPMRRPSMHRRMSFDSLPSPSEILGTPVHSLCYSSSSQRTRCYTSSSEDSHLSYSDASTIKTGHRGSASLLVIPRSLNLSQGFY